ncbi:MAG: 2-C-methyl-D-erythritol 2,4-cyclodiphosphate synthase [bacterium]|nr:2-C-methyl-D-erythritol 2,4-cyclodiphosphate synthase [bacterium]
MEKIRVGIGYDIHQLQSGRDLILGGVKIPFEKGLLGHSDADVLIHAIIDAILGSLAMRDIGTLFPDNDAKFKDISSVLLLEKVYALVKEQGWKIGNIDSNIIAQQPKMMPHIMQMRENLAKVLELDIEDISIKAKTNEKLDAVGELKAIEANSVVLMVKK